MLTAPLAMVMAATPAVLVAATGGVVSVVVAQAADQCPQAERQGQHTEQPDPVLRHDDQSEFGDDADRDEGDQAELLAGDDLPGPWPTLADGGDDQHDDVVDVGAGERGDGRGDGGDHCRTA